MAKKDDKKVGVIWPIEAEQGVLGCLQLFPALWDSYADRLTADLFSSACHKAIFRALSACQEDKVNAATVILTIRDQGNLEIIKGTVAGVKHDGISYVSALLEFASMSHGFSDWIKACEEAAARRKIIEVSEAAVKKVLEGEATDETIARVTLNLAGVAEGRVRENMTGKLFDEMDARIEQRKTGKIKLGLPTGVPAWDSALTGVFPGEMTVLGARPKVGKTAMIEEAIFTQAQSGHTVAVFQKDMSPVIMLERIACRYALVVFEKYIAGLCTSGELHAIKEASKVLRKLFAAKVHFFTDARLTTGELGGIVRRLKKQAKLAAWYLDHFLTLAYDANNVTEGTTENSKQLRALITETQVPGIIVAHLNRESDKTGRPHAGQFKYCDQLFADCDRAILLWSEVDPKSLNPHERQTVEFTVDANRFGSVSDNKMSFHRELMIFEQWQG